MDMKNLLIYVLTGDFGLLTMTPSYLLCMLGPLITAFYFVQNLLAESGLLYRLANVCDRPLSKIGLSGSTLIPMLLGFGCTTVALAAISVHPDKRQRLIGSILLSIMIPCSAQVAIIFTMAFLMHARYTFIYIIFITSTFMLLSLFLNAFIPGFKGRPAAVSLPALRIPAVKKILISSIKSGLLFLKETAGPFVFGSLIVSLLTYIGCFSKLCAWFAPVTQGFLHLPQQAASLFMLSIIKRDLGAAGLLSIVQNGGFTEGEITVCLIILTLFVPCFASVILLFKQQKPAEAIAIWLGSFILSMLAGKLASLLLL